MIRILNHPIIFIITDNVTKSISLIVLKSYRMKMKVYVRVKTVVLISIVKVILLLIIMVGKNMIEFKS